MIRMKGLPGLDRQSVGEHSCQEPVCVRGRASSYLCSKNGEGVIVSESHDTASLTGAVELVCWYVYTYMYIYTYI